MNYKLASVSLAVLALSFPALAADPAHTPVKAATTADHHDVSDDTKDFIKNAAIGGMYEIESSKLASTNSTNEDVKKFADQMIKDHTKASADLKKAVADGGLEASLIPTAVDEDHKKMIDDLKDESKKDFDEDYVEDQVAAHKKTIELFEDYAKDGDNAALKMFATKTLPTLQQHKSHIDGLEKSVDD